MRILINAVSAKAGGGITYLVNLLRYLPDLMKETEFLCVIQDIKLPKDVFQHKNLQIKVIPQASGNVLKRYWWENTGLIKLCKTWKADILYCIANMIPIIPAPCDCYVMLQNVAPITPKVLSAILKSEGIKPFLQMTLNCLLTLFGAAISKKTFVLSEHSDNLIKKLIPFSKTVRVHHGISDIFKYTSNRPEKSGNDPYFIFVSNIYVYKGLEFIIEAYKYKPDLPHIFIVGHAYDINYSNKLKQEISNNGLQDKIIFLDSLPYSELPAWYSNAIANVFPTWCESFGCGIIEAQACGCPVIGMQTATLAEFCNDKSLLAMPFDGKGLAEIMEKSAKFFTLKKPSNNLNNSLHSFSWESAMLIHKKTFLES